MLKLQSTLDSLAFDSSQSKKKKTWIPIRGEGNGKQLYYLSQDFMVIHDKNKENKSAED